MLNIAMPLTGSRLYHCVVSFLEPITLVFVLKVHSIILIININLFLFNACRRALRGVCK